MTTLDGYEGNVHGEVPCDYYFVQHKDFSIIGLLVDCFRTNISCIKKIQINYQADTWFLHQGKAVPNRATDKVGKPINLPFESNGIKMERSGNYVVVSLPNGVIVLWNGIRNAEIQVPIAFMKKVQGGYYFGCVIRKLVVGISDQVRHNQAYITTEDGESLLLEISDFCSRWIVLCETTKCYPHANCYPGYKIR